MPPRRASSRDQRVLIVDDQDLERTLIRHRLRFETMEMIEASNGEMAIRLARNEIPDAILLDINLPGTSGLDVLRALKDDPATRSIPVICISGRAETEVKVRALDLGAIDYITKPFDPAELRARLRVAFRIKYYQDLLEEQAHLDALTGLANRHALEERFASDRAACERRGAAMALLILDLDHFKRINDLFGHATGDEALRLVSGALRTIARTSDIVARYGGEEFVVLAPDCDLTGAIVLADRARDAVESLTLRAEGTTVTITTSIGVAATTAPTANDLFAQADRALYEAKTSGRNVVWAWCPTTHRPVFARDLASVPI